MKPFERTATLLKSFCLALALLLPVVAQADPQTDADYIVSQQVTKEMFEGALSAQRPILVSAITNDLSQQGINLPDPDRFFDIFVEEFIDEFTESMQSQSAALYMDAYTADELSGIAAFLKTDAGQAMTRKAPQLMMAGAQLGERAGMQAGQNASARVAARLEAEGLDLFEDPSLMQQLLDALR